MKPETQSLPATIQTRIGEMPLLPVLVQRLVALDMNDDGAYDEVVAIAEEDPVFATRILALANSAFLAPSEEITSIRQAVARVGAWRVGELATAMAMMDVFTGPGEAAELLWKHSVEVAVGARTLAKSSGAEPGEAYIAGLVHDLGRMVMLSAGGEAARLAGEMVEVGGADQLSVHLEAQQLGFDHAQVGAAAAKHIGLPDKFVALIAIHHELEPGDADAALAALLQIADALSVFSHVTPEAFEGEALEAAAASVLGAVAMETSLDAAGLAEAIPGILEEAARAVGGLGALT
jgi:putative nucleotidyltransferase with HDIG domain